MKSVGPTVFLMQASGTPLQDAWDLPVICSLRHLGCHYHNTLFIIGTLSLSALLISDGVFSQSLAGARLVVRRSGGYSTCVPRPALYMGSEDLNSGSHTAHALTHMSAAL